ncbi:hypothetical protein BC939DRAFT_8298 [Gamsiella multidivaricata]|uniref:uncharacterized protein n=1 Tax=Gamsiella multidivaricata TaxID=101098 RepID=UPI00221FB3E3|nr:uncharacterized protein BC939DRAFT_8298 [Gamsiella multidivaricata]KAI7832845.1 hypothetical protein BC939DRAFT_8298 [Gamsiella multidivaricata]
MESQVCSSETAHELAAEKYGELFRLLFIGDKVEIKADPLKNQTSYGKKTTTMSRLLKDHPNTYGQAALDGHMKRVFANHKARKQAAAEGTEPPVPPDLPSNDSVKEHYAISNMMRTDGVQLHLMAFDIRRCWQSSKFKARIPEITSRFPNKGSLAKAFDQDLQNVVGVGVDPGEVISASFCTLDLRKPNQVTNLPIRHSALYSPNLSLRAALEAKKRERTTVTIKDDTRLSGHTCETPSISELEASLPSSSFVSMEEHRHGLRQFSYVLQPLRDFYGSRSMKKKLWELKKANRAEKDHAVHGALRTVDSQGGMHTGPTRPAMFVYEPGKFNTHTRLASLHESFKGYYFHKVCRYSLRFACFQSSIDTDAMFPHVIALHRQTASGTPPFVRMSISRHRNAQAVYDKTRTEEWQSHRIGRSSVLRMGARDG